MKVFRFHAPGDVRLEEAPEPQVGAGEVKLRVRACSMCGTDVKIASAGHLRIRPPRIMGHEIAGEIVWGIGIHHNIVTASLRAVVCAANRAQAVTIPAQA